MDRLKRHYDWSGKDCPHKMHATGTYQAFRNRVQAHLNVLNKGAVASKPSAKPASKKKSVNIGGWKKNKYGTQYMKEKGTWKNGGTRVMSRFGSPFRSAPEGGWAKPGWKCKYDEIVRQDGHIWLGYTVSGKRKYIPVKTWNSKTGEVGKDWGTFS